MHANALPFAGTERPGLVPDRVRDPEPAEVVRETGAAQQLDVGLREPKLRAGNGGKIRDRVRVAERVRRFEVDEVGDREQRRVEPVLGQHDRKRGLRVDDGLPGGHRFEV